MSNYSHSLKEGLRNMIRHPLVTIASFTTIALTLFVVSCFLCFVVNATGISNRIEQSPPVEVYAEIGIEDDKLKAIENALSQSELVQDYTHLSPEENYKIYQESMGDNKDVLEGLDVDRFPNLFIVHLKDSSSSEQFSLEMYQYLGVRKIRFDNNLIDFLAGIRKYVYIGSFVSFLVLVIISFFIISNMVRLSVFARGEEISIMKYIGATNSFIRMPYVVEGILVGILGAIFSSTAIYFIYRVLYLRLMQGVSQTDVLRLIPPSGIIFYIAIISSLIGILVGGIGSAVSVRKHINV